MQFYCLQQRLRPDILQHEAGPGSFPRVTTSLPFQRRPRKPQDPGHMYVQGMDDFQGHKGYGLTVMPALGRDPCSGVTPLTPEGLQPSHSRSMNPAGQVQKGVSGPGTPSSGLLARPGPGDVGARGLWEGPHGRRAPGPSCVQAPGSCPRQLSLWRREFGARQRGPAAQHPVTQTPISASPWRTPADTPLSQPPREPSVSCTGRGSGSGAVASPPCLPLGQFCSTC